MRTYQQALTAGETVTLTVNGSFFALIEAAGAVDLEFQYVGAAGTGGYTEIAKGMNAGYSEVFPGMLTSVIVSSSIDQQILYGCGSGSARFDRTAITSSQASITDNIDPVALGITATLVLAADATRRRLILTNPTTNTGAIALGGPSLTAANAARWLEPGDSYIETDAAPAALYGLADIAGEEINIEVA